MLAVCTWIRKRESEEEPQTSKAGAWATRARILFTIVEDDLRLNAPGWTGRYAGEDQVPRRYISLDARVGPLSCV